MGILKLFLVIFIFNNYFNQVKSKSVDLSDDAEEHALLFDTFSKNLEKDDKISTRSVRATKSPEVEYILNSLIQKYPEAATFLQSDALINKIAALSAAAKDLIKYIVDGLSKIEINVDPKQLEDTIIEILTDTSSREILKPMANNPTDSLVVENDSPDDSSPVEADSPEDSPPVEADLPEDSPPIAANPPSTDAGAVSVRSSQEEDVNLNKPTKSPETEVAHIMEMFLNTNLDPQKTFLSSVLRTFTAKDLVSEANKTVEVPEIGMRCLSCLLKMLCGKKKKKKKCKKKKCKKKKCKKKKCKKKKCKKNKCKEKCKKKCNKKCKKKCKKKCNKKCKKKCKKCKEKDDKTQSRILVDSQDLVNKARGPQIIDSLVTLFFGKNIMDPSRMV